MADETMSAEEAKELDLINANLATPEGKAYGVRTYERSREVFASTPKDQLDIAYGSDPQQQLDYFLPETGPDERVPAVFFVHGGSFTGGSRKWTAFMASAINAIPAAFISVSYRLAPANRFPDQLHDVADAFAWMYTHADELKIDRNRIIVAGHSAGGNLTALLTIRPDLLEARGVSADAIKACFPISGLFDVRLNPDEPHLARLHENLLVRGEDAELASPVLHLEGAKAHFHIFQGTRDFPVVAASGRRMVEALEAANVPHSFEEVDGYDHFDTHERSVDPDHVWLTRLKQQLGQL